ncbi:MAG: dipicolinate synthase subunit A N-terminal domain-containing protein [[Ruminococcus] torques]
MSSFSYDFSVLGGDARQVFLAEMLAESGRSLCHYALASQPNNCSSVSEHVSIVREAPSLEEACIHSGSVICPFPFTKNGADVSVENSIYRFSIQTLLHLLRPGQSLFAGGIPPSFKKRSRRK